MSAKQFNTNPQLCHTLCIPSNVRTFHIMIMLTLKQCSDNILKVCWNDSQQYKIDKILFSMFGLLLQCSE